MYTYICKDADFVECSLDGYGYQTTKLGKYALLWLEQSTVHGEKPNLKLQSSKNHYKISECLCVKM